MRRQSTLGVLAAIVLTGMAAAPASAQQAAPAADPRFTASGGYSFLREGGTGGGPVHDYNKGFVGSFSGRLGASRAEWVGEAGMNFRQDTIGTDQRLLGLLGGIRVRIFRLGRLTLFGQALGGLERFSTPGFSENGAAFQPGGGIDAPMSGRVKLRVQGDYRLAHAEGVNFHEGRLAVSVAFGIR